MNKILLLKESDKIIGNILNIIIPKKKPDNSIKKINKILIIRPGGMGDAVLLIPAIEKIREVYPEATIDILAEKRNYEVFNFIDFVDNIYCYDNIKTFISILRYKSYDIVFDTEQWHILSSIVARFLGQFTVGFDTNSRSKNLDIKVKYSHNDYEVESFLNLVNAYCEYLNIDFDGTWHYPFINIGKTERLHDVCIFTGASIDYRKWQVKKYRKLAKLLIDKGLELVLIGAKSDTEFNKRIANSLNISNLTGKTSLKETAKIIASSKLLFSTDSGILHLGAAVGVKTVSLFGPGIENKWVPKGKRHITLNKHLKCSPCTKFGYTPKCKFNSRCIKEITVDEVFKTIIKLSENQTI